MNFNLVPNKLFLTKGVGKYKEREISYHLALRKAGIERYNLNKISSIFPPNCEVISKEKGLESLVDGEIVFSVISMEQTNEPNRHIFSSIGVAIPKDRNQYGYISKYFGYGKTDEQAGDYAEDLAATMLATRLGFEINLDKAWNQRKKEYKLSGNVYKSMNITQSASGDKYGLWTTVISAAILLVDFEYYLKRAVKYAIRRGNYKLITR